VEDVVADGAGQGSIGQIVLPLGERHAGADGEGDGQRCSGWCLRGLFLKLSDLGS